MSLPADAGLDPGAARDLLDEGLQHLAAGKARRAIKVLDRALGSVMTRAPRTPAEGSLRRRIAAALLRALREAGRHAELERRGEELVLAGVDDAPLAEKVVTRLAFEEKRTDPAAMEVYVAAVEAGVSLSQAVRERLNQILAFGLHIRLTSRLADVRAFVPLLERLHRARPRLTFARLYLGRFHYLGRDYATARSYLQGIEGRLAASPKILNVRARCAEKLGLSDEALSTYRASLEEDFHQPHVHFRIGRLLLHRFRGDREDGAAR